MKSPRAVRTMLLCLGLCRVDALRAAEVPASPGLRRARLNVVVSESLFGHLNPNDAIASMRIWTEQLGKIRGFQLDWKMEISHSPGEIRKLLNEKLVDLLVLDTPDYLLLADLRLVESLAAGSSRGELGAFPYLLLTNNSSETTQLAGLRGKRIVVASRTTSNMGLIWLETLLATNHLGRARSFFANVEVSPRSSSCVLPLFFGKVDACVVDSGNWDSLRELNPQLGKLRVLAHSDPLLEGLIAMPLQPHPYQVELVKSLLEMHKAPAGEQIGLVFRTGPLIRAGKEAFESVRVLQNNYRRFVESSSAGAGPAADRPRTDRQGVLPNAPQ